MITEQQNILMFSRMMGLGGTEKVIIQLCKILVPQVHKIVVCSTDGLMVPKLKSMGATHYKIPDITDKSPYNVIRILHILSKIIKKENIRGFTTLCG